MTKLYCAIYQHLGSSYCYVRLTRGQGLFGIFVYYTKSGGGHFRDGVRCTAGHNRDVKLMLIVHSFKVSYTPFAVALQTVVLLNVALSIGYCRVLPCDSSA
jgi:hypothetical protein